MKIHASMTACVLASSAMLLGSSCSSPKGETTTTALYEPGVPGGVTVRTYETRSTVTAMDATTRKVTLVDRNGKKSTVTAGPEVINFDQIRIGDQVRARLTEQWVVSMADPNAQPMDHAATSVGLAPVGAKPGAWKADVTQVTATVKKIDLKRHKATLEFPDGSTETFPVRKDVDLNGRKVGEKVSLRTIESVAISVERP